MSHLTAILSLSSLQGEVSEHVSAVDNWNDEDDEDSDTSDSSEQRLKEAAQRLREVYYRAVLSECPQRDVLFHCALGLSLTCMAGDLDLAVFILEGLLSSGYMVQQCRLALAKCAHRDGRILRARRLLTDCLRDDPTDSDARDFQAEFDTAVKRDGKIAVYGVIAAVAAIAIGWTAYRQTGCSSPSTALLSHTAPSGAAVSTSLSAQ